MSMHSSPIDAVVTWVDGTCPFFINQKEHYALQHLGEQYSKEETSQHRYDTGEDLTICLLSIISFAPYIRKIFIVTNESPRCLDEVIFQRHPEWRMRIECVKHSVIFEGFEEYLPTFNSLSIETMLHRIPGLSERYIYFNDDFFLVRKTYPQDFFCDGLPKISGYLTSTRSLAVKYDSYKARSSKTVGFVIPMVNAAILANTEDCFPRLYHSPYVFRKSVLELFFKKYPDLIRHNIAHRFRDYEQFSTAALAASLEFKASKIRPISLLRHVYLKPIKRSAGYCFLKLLPYYLMPRIKFSCFQGLSLASTNVRTYCEVWISNRIKLDVNEAHSLRT